MSQLLQVWLRSGELGHHAAYNLPRCADALIRLASTLGVAPLFTFASGYDEASELAESHVLGKPEGDIEDDDEVDVAGERVAVADLSDAQWDDLRRRINAAKLDLLDWYDPAEGLRALEALIRYIESEPAFLASIPVDPFSAWSPEGVSFDMRGLRDDLLAAQSRGVRFRLWYN